MVLRNTSTGILYVTDQTCKMILCVPICNMFFCARLIFLPNQGCRVPMCFKMTIYAVD